MSSTSLVAPRDPSTRLDFVVASDEIVPGELWVPFQSWLLAGGYSQSYVEQRALVTADVTRVQCPTQPERAD